MDNNFSFNNTTIRRHFLCKVYSIVMCQLLIAIAFVTMANFHDPTRIFIKSHPGLSIIASIITLGILIVLSCYENLRRKSPNNFIFLFIITLALSFLLATSVSRFYPNQVLLALSLATLICVGLTLFAIQTKIDFTAMGFFLMVAVMVLLITSIIAILFPEKTMTLIITCAGAIIYSLYLIYDTQMIVGGTHTYSISPEEYMFAALAIYIDIVNIFFNILSFIVLDD